MDINSKKIAKNTFYLYFRFLLILLVNLYSSRVVLEELGVSDFGLYNVVYSIIGFLSFLSGTLGGSTSRFLTYELGVGNIEKLKETFRTSWVAHILLSLIILVVAESVGLWYVMKVMVVPHDRYVLSLIIYQISILSTILSVIQIPFTAAIVAHESMSAYAWIGIFEALAKLAVAFFITFNLMGSKLFLYALLLLIVSAIVFMLYVLYSHKKFLEVSLLFSYDKKILKSLLKFSGWGILANLCNVISINGVVLLFNIFFSPIIVAAQTIANQVATGISQLTYNVRSAVNPQIIKLYADEDYAKSQHLTISSAELLFDLSIIACYPCIIVMPFLLNIWLVHVPACTVLFTRLLLFQSVLDTFNASYYAPMLAANKIAKNSIWGLVVNFLQFIILYVIFRFGGEPIWARILGIITVFLMSFIIKPYILYKDIKYPIKEMQKSLLLCLRKIFVVSIIIGVLYVILPQKRAFDSISLFVISVIVICIVLFLMMPKHRKKYILKLIKLKLRNEIE